MPAERPSPRAVLLDLDGTLLDTAPDLVGTANQLLEEHGHPPRPPRSYGHGVTLGSAALLQRAFHVAPGSEVMVPLQERFLALYRERLARHTRPFAGMETVLEFLEARGLPWGVVTNKPQAFTRPLLQALNLDARAGCVICGDMVPRAKPHPAAILRACQALAVPPAAAVMVGDAQRDIVAGQAAGCWTAVSLFGYLCAEDRPGRWGADVLLDSPEDLPRWLERLDGLSAPRSTARSG